MSTRGSWGFRMDGKDKLTYNHCDSYPSGLGETIKQFIITHSIEELKSIADNIVLVDKDSTPTQKQINECQKFADQGVSTGKLTEWYVLLREAQGNPEAYTKGLKYMISYPEFIKDSLFCEWAYIINLDTETLEVYTGFQEIAQDNRYKNYLSKPDGYANCSLIKEIPLNEVAQFDMNTLEKLG